MSNNISFVCPYCRAAPMKSPELLCEHMVAHHEARDLVEEKEFETGEELECWLNRIEEGRSEGGVLGSDEEKSEDDTQFYILCHRKSTPQPKRRRLETPEETDAGDSVISCTAFVHIVEKMDGTYHVTYCLEHCGTCDCAESQHEDVKSRKKNNQLKKRNHEDTEDGPSSSGGSMGNQSDSMNRGQDAFDLSAMNKFLNHRIDSAASSLKALHQMISGMAMDANNLLWDPQLVPVHFPIPNEIYTS